MITNRTIARGVVALASVLWICAVLLWAVTLIPPVQPQGGAVIVPEVVRAGETFTVQRRFAVRWPTVVFIKREIIQGDCSAHCDVHVLSSELDYLDGKQYVRKKHHQLPPGIEPGIWRFSVEMQWQDLFGFYRTVRLEPVYFTVVR